MATLQLTETIAGAIGTVRRPGERSLVPSRRDPPADRVPGTASGA